MRLCMFHPVGHAMERGWVGRIEGDRVIHLAAQTLQSFFTGGGQAREHAQYALDEVELLAPVLHPPAVRIFDDQRSFEFANPAAIAGSGATIVIPLGAQSVSTAWRPAAVVGDGSLGGFTLLGDVRAAALRPPKDRDFALLLGPLLVTPDEHRPAGFDWEAALALAAANTRLRSGDILAGPVLQLSANLEAGAQVAFEHDAIGRLEAALGGAP